MSGNTPWPGRSEMAAPSLPAPLPLSRSIPYFMLPALALGVISWWGIPALNRAGVPLIWSFTCLVVGFFLVLGGSAVVAARKDQPRRLASRLWLHPCRSSDVLLGVVVGTAGLLAYESLQGVTVWVLGLWPFGVPAWAPSFSADAAFLGVSLADNRWLIAVFIAIFLANVVGEELWWRGYLLPRQASAMGQWAWVANGLLWSLFHIFHPWDIVPLIPIALAMAYMAQRRKSVWLPIVAHAVLNAQAWVSFIGQMT
jgi:membrane protease YdiL (CAAX protease family)